jgi:hypothetical protein
MEVLPTAELPQRTSLTFFVLFGFFNTFNLSLLLLGFSLVWQMHMADQKEYKENIDKSS